MTKPLNAIIIGALVASASLAAGCIEPFKGTDVEPNGTDGDTNTTNPPPSTGTPGNSTPPKVINDAPVPSVTIHNDVDPVNATTRGYKGDVLMLNGSGSTDPDGFITKWEWEIFEPAGGDTPPEPVKHEGEKVSGITFGTEGVKIVKLTVTDNLGKQASTSTFYYRDVSYSYGDQFHWSAPQTNEEIVEEREHKLPVLAGAAGLAAHIVVDGAKAEIALIDPAGTEHIRGVTETDNVTILMDHGAPEAGEWTIKVWITYTNPGTEECLPEAGCHVLPLPPASWDADYGLDGIVWYGELPEEPALADDGHDH